MRALRSGFSENIPENLGRTRQSTTSMQSHLQQKKVQFKEDKVSKTPRAIRNESKYHLPHQGAFVEEYTSRGAHVFAQIIEEMSHLNLTTKQEKKFYSFVQQYGIGKGIKKSGKKGNDAAMKEMKQLHDRTVFKPVDISKLTKEERDQAMNSLIFLVEKRDGRVKGRACADGSIQKKNAAPGESAS